MRSTVYTYTTLKNNGFITVRVPYPCGDTSTNNACVIPNDMKQKYRVRMQNTGLESALLFRTDG